MEREVKGIFFPIEIWENSDLSWNEKILLMEIDSFSSKGKPCYISNEYIAQLLKIKENTASIVLSKLIKKGYVRVVKFDGRHRFIESLIGFGVASPSKADFEKNQRLGLKKVKGSLDDTSIIVTNSIYNSENSSSELFEDGNDCLEETKAISTKHQEKERANSLAADTLAQRIAKFKQKCYEYEGEFGGKLIEDFFLYWSETKEHGKQMKWEKQSTFDIHRRLCRWRNNNFGNRYQEEEKSKDISAEEAMRRAGWI